MREGRGCAAEVVSWARRVGAHLPPDTVRAVPAVCIRQSDYATKEVCETMHLQHRSMLLAGTTFMLSLKVDFSCISLVLRHWCDAVTCPC